MKYLILLLLVSCATQPKQNCEEIERDNILGTTFSVLKCDKPIDEKIGECTKEVGKDGKYMCFAHGNWWRKVI